MSLKTTATRYGSVAILIHWASALAVILAFAAGFTVADLAPPDRQGPILIAHVTLGSIVFVLTLLRIVWWLVADKRPQLPADEAPAQQMAARIVHYALYAILILLGTSGIMTLVLSGALPTILSGGPVPDFSELIPRVAHGVMSTILLALFIGHVGAALWHQFVRHDHLLARMGVGRAGAH
jgi:cytochrome b561